MTFVCPLPTVQGYYSSDDDDSNVARTAVLNGKVQQMIVYVRRGTSENRLPEYSTRWPALLQ
jgi:hypothetical protein